MSVSVVRDLPAAVVTRIKERVVRPAVLIYADLPDGARRVWTGRTPITFDGHTWAGVGEVLSLSGLGEDTQTLARGISLRLNSMDPDMAAAIVGQPYQGRACAVWMGFWDETRADLSIIERPVFEGRLDSDDMEENGESANLTLRAEHRLVDALRRREWRYTEADQAALHPGETDTGLLHIAGIQDLQLPWGRTDK